MSEERVEAIPPDFWDLGAVGDALDRRDLGRLLDLVCELCHISQYALGEIIGLRQSQISRYIHHTNKPTLDTIAKIASKLGMPARAQQRLGFGRTSAAKMPKVRLSRILALAECIGQTDDTSILATWREIASTKEAEDTWTQVGLSMSVEEPTELPAVERMSARTRGFFWAAAKLPARLVIEALTAHANDVRLLLDAIPDPVLRRQLTSLGGETSYLAACCSADLGDPDGALRRLELASDAAQRAKDTALSAIALDGYSHLHDFRGDHHAALNLIEQGVQASLISGSSGTMAYMKLRAAEERIELNDPRAAASAWEEAERRFANTDVYADRNWTRLWLMPSGFESVRTTIYSATGHRSEAVAIARSLVAKLHGALGKSDAIALVNVAVTLSNAGMHEEAAQAGQQALQAIRATEAAGCMPRLHALTQSARVASGTATAWLAFADDIQATQRQLDRIRTKPGKLGNDTLLSCNCVKQCSS